MYFRSLSTMSKNCEINLSLHCGRQSCAQPCHEGPSLPCPVCHSTVQGNGNKGLCSSYIALSRGKADIRYVYTLGISSLLNMVLSFLLVYKIDSLFKNNYCWYRLFQFLLSILYRILPEHNYLLTMILKWSVVTKRHNLKYNQVLMFTTVCSDLTVIKIYLKTVDHFLINIIFFLNVPWKHNFFIS